MSRVLVKRLGCLLVLALLASESAAWAGTPPPLRFDPFRDRPERVVARGAAARSGSASAFEPILLSTVVGGERPLANLGGEILAIGEEAHGYRLLEVQSFEATFEKDGERVRLEVLVGQRRDR